MRVNIYNTIEVSDEQRVHIADLADKKVSKRQATRDEIKAFVWEEGEYWAGSLEALHRNFTKPDGEDYLGSSLREPGSVEPEYEDLVGFVDHSAAQDGLSAEELDELL